MGAVGAGDAVSVRGLVKRYPKAPVNAVDGVSFEVGRQEVFGLLGPNGAGKTTTVGFTRVVRTPTVVVLPAPFGPSSPNTSCLPTSKLTPSTALTGAFG